MRSVRRSLTLVAVLTIAQLFGATASMAGGGVIGPVTIKGKLYLNGDLIKVNCAGSEGNFLEGGAFGERIFFIEHPDDDPDDDDCPLWEDTGSSDEFRFIGEEEQIFVNGSPKNVFIFSGTEGGTGPVLGAAHSQQKFKDDFVLVSEKGELTYSYSFGENTVIFVGTFKAIY